VIIDDPLQAGRFHVQQQSEPAGHWLEEPDVNDRSGQLDVAHSPPANTRVTHLDAALIAHDAPVLHPPKLAARTLPVLLRAEDALAEQAVLLRTIAHQVDRLGHRYLAGRPGPNIRRARQADPHRGDVVDALAVTHVCHPQKKRPTESLVWSA